ncbi:MAG: aminoacyl-histidine dipeptidase [Calditrichia bacterium]
MKEVIAGLKPELMWEHFYEISQIPRCSRNEEAVREYVLGVAKRNNLEYKIDAVGNVVVKVPATPGKEDKPIVVLQGHLDMVCEKNKGTEHDFSKDPIKLVRDGDWMKADGTTLGSDNGIFIAAALAAMEDKELVHGPLECLFTIDEETGLTGAIELGTDMLEGRILLNLDSEEDGALYIGCAGGRDTEFFFDMESEAVPAEFKPALVKVLGLKGGHSGLNIHEERGNAIKLLNRFLWKVLPEVGGRLASIEGGSKHNAIPREAEAVVYLPGGKLADLKARAAEFEAIYKNELKFIDPDVKVEILENGFEAPETMFTSQFHNKLLNFLYVVPHGVIAMSLAVPGLVETSTNLAVVTVKEGKLSILTSQRSSVDSALDNINDMVKACGYLAGAKVHSGGGYPAWAPNPDSMLLKTTKKVFNELFGKEPEVKAIHAGLECGIIGGKFPGMDMISFGPTIQGAHSPDEKVQISAVERFWKLLEGILKELSN